jgi:tetratricopeptide (TPR) repeat protein
MSFLNRTAMVVFLVFAWAGVANLSAAQDETAPVSYGTVYNHMGEKYLQSGLCDLMPHGSRQDAYQSLVNAEQLFRKAIEINYYNTDAHRNLARLYYFEKKLDLADVEYATTIRLDPNNIDARVDMALLQAERGNPKEAIRHLQDAKNRTRDPGMIQRLNRYMTPLERAGYPEGEKGGHHPGR